MPRITKGECCLQRGLRNDFSKKGTGKMLLCALPAEGVKSQRKEHPMKVSWTVFDHLSKNHVCIARVKLKFGI